MKKNSNNYNNEMNRHISENSLKKDYNNNLKLKKPPDEYSKLVFI